MAGETTVRADDHLITPDNAVLALIDYRPAVEATGRKKVIMTGLWTEVCVAFPTLDLLREGYEVYPVAEAIGGISRQAHDSAMQRMASTGAQTVTGIRPGARLRRRPAARAGPARDTATPVAAPADGCGARSEGR